MTAGIYAITNTANRKRYIGSAVDVQGRWRSHRGALLAGRHFNRHLQSAWNKYGESSFDFSVLEIVEDLEQLILREQAHIDEAGMKELYNARPMAGNNLGLKLSEEARHKMSEALRGHATAEGTRRKIGLAHLGMVHSAETRRKMSIAKRGRPLGEVQRRRLREVTLGKPLSEEHRRKIGDANRGKPRAPMSAAQRQKLSVARKGRVMSEENKRKLLEYHLGHVTPEETRRKQRESQQGVPKGAPSAETRRKLSESLKRYWAVQRMESES
jgi:group I intron endonuclease